MGNERAVCKSYELGKHRLVGEGRGARPGTE